MHRLAFAGLCLAESAMAPRQKQIVESDPVISPLVVDKKVKIAGGVYDVATGKVALVA